MQTGVRIHRSGECRNPEPDWAPATAGVTFHARACPVGLLLPLTLFIAVLVAACSGPTPILYPNAHLKQVGREVAEQDIAACQEIAEEAGAKPAPGRAGQVATSTGTGAGIGAAAGAAGGAVVGSAGTGAAVGAVSGSVWGFLRGLFRKKEPSQAYKRFVDRCLTERGYEPVGWQ